ncbi:hypothetical protein ABT214_28900, partial [Micromonospora purpureochromogenes]|uniref:hypothetical protein n=1 Tax=Micromonospora purpureochromogenes TaxID=47872 RepID=UPI003316A814
MSFAAASAKKAESGIEVGVRMGGGPTRVGDVDGGCCDADPLGPGEAADGVGVGFDGTGEGGAGVSA